MIEIKVRSQKLSDDSEVWYIQLAQDGVGINLRSGCDSHDNALRVADIIGKVIEDWTIEDTQMD
jgi:hypothetical protein